MNLEDIMAKAKTDAKLNYSELGQESIKLTDLQVEWLNIFTTEKLVLAKMNKEYSKTYKERWDYYLGKAPDEVYKNEPQDHKIMRGDVEIYLNADDKLAVAASKIDLQKEKVNFVEGVVKALHQRGFSIRAAIDYMKFTSGAG